MNMIKTSGKLDQLVGTIKSKFATLGDTDYALLAEGKFDEFKGMVKEKIGEAQDQQNINDQVDAYRQGLKDANATDSCGCGNKHHSA